MTDQAEYFTTSASQHATWRCTGQLQLRVYSSGVAVLEQAWQNMDDGQIEWRPVPTVKDPM